MFAREPASKIASSPTCATLGWGREQETEDAFVPASTCVLRWPERLTNRILDDPQ
jgi:hypothetical protein